MRRGDFAASWAVNDQVLHGRDKAERDDPAQPYHLRWVWDGRPFDGRRVLVRCYHGLGDTIQFCRYLPLLRRRVAHLSLEVQPPLLDLLAPLPGPDQLIPFRPGRPSASADCDLEIMELAHALRSLPDPVPYLRAAPLPRLEAAVLAGLCWHVDTGWDPGRSVPLPLLRALEDVPGVRLVSLQRGAGADHAGQPGAPAMLQEASMDLLHTARRIASLDLVVTVDTMVAHLAGALGRPVWVLLQHEADWRWMAGRSTPWYGSARLYRQPAPGDWHTPVRQVVADLAALVQEKAGAGGTALAGRGL